MNDVMLQLQDKDDFSPSWVKSAVCQHCYSLCRVWHHLPEVKGSGILSLIWNTRSLSHTRAQSRAHIILPRCTLAHVIACLHTWIQACTNTCIQALKDMRAHAHTHTQSWVCDRWRRLIASALHHEWQQEVVMWREGKWICWLCLFVCEAISHLSFAAYFHPTVIFLSSATGSFVPHLILLSFHFLFLKSPSVFQ